MYKRILVAVDGSVASRLGLEEAIRLAKAGGAVLKLVHVVDTSVLNAGDTAMFFDRVIQSLREAGAKVLADCSAIARKADVPVEQELVETMGQVAAEIVQQVRVWGADLMVIGTHGRRGLRRLTMGSDAEMVLRQSPVPVLMVRDRPEAA